MYFYKVHTRMYPYPFLWSKYHLGHIYLRYRGKYRMTEFSERSGRVGCRQFGGKGKTIVTNIGDPGFSIRKTTVNYKVRRTSVYYEDFLSLEKYEIQVFKSTIDRIRSCPPRVLVPPQLPYLKSSKSLLLIFVDRVTDRVSFTT